MRTVLVFEDEPLRSENLLYLHELRGTLTAPDLRLEIAEVIPHAELVLKRDAVIMAILDIKARVPRDFRTFKDDTKVDDALAGLELLRRIRGGHYGRAAAGMPVFMRSARSEPHIRQTCFASGCSAYFLPTQMEELLAKIREALGGSDRSL